VDKRYDESRMRRFFTTLCLCLPAAVSLAQPAASSNAQSPQIHEMQQVEDRWSDAVTKRDQYGMELVLAPQFIGISASGEVTTRNQQIARLFIKGTGPESLEQKVVTVRLVGDVAIVNGTYVLTWKGEKGPVEEKGIFSHVFEHIRTNWLCLNSQRTVVAEQTQNEAGKSRSKHGDAGANPDLPPVYKGPASATPPPADQAAPSTAPPPAH
jgi:ketosteroid isomerase-like protein